MLRYIFALLLVFSAGLTAFAIPIAAMQEDGVRDGLARASSLYYEANFKEAIDLLLHLDETLRVENGRLPEKTGVKLQLALAYVALNDTGQARSRFDELYALDPNYSLDTQQYAPKILSIADEAKTEQDKVRTLRLCDGLRKQIESESLAVSVDEVLSMKSRCRDLPLFTSKAADLFYKRGIEAYKRDDLAGATQMFRSALRLDPEHELAAQYTELIQQKTRVSADRILLEWRKDFDSREFAPAAVAYRRLDSLNGDGGVTPLLNQARSEYRKAMPPLVESWTRACAAGDVAAMTSLRKQAAELLPDPSIAEDLLGQMTCASKPAAKPATPAATVAKTCVAMDSRLALVRLKTRVDPVIPPVVYNVLRHSSMTVRVQARIEETGAVTVVQTIGENAALNTAVRTAVEQWKFSPAIVRDETRCVETEIPVVIGLDGGR